MFARPSFHISFLFLLLLLLLFAFPERNKERWRQLNLSRQRPVTINVIYCTTKWGREGRVEGGRKGRGRHLVWVGARGDERLLRFYGKRWYQWDFLSFTFFFFKKHFPANIPGSERSKSSLSPPLLWPWLPYAGWTAQQKVWATLDEVDSFHRQAPNLTLSDGRLAEGR